MIVFFACRHGRVRDIGLVRSGIQAAGHRFALMLLPYAYPVLLLLAPLHRLGIVKAHLILSDKFLGDGLLAWLYGAQCSRMLWNYADEFGLKNMALPKKKVCFFDDQSPGVSVFRFAPEPVPTTDAEPHRRLIRPVVFVGDVSLDFPLDNGVEWWRERFEALCQRHGYAFYLHPDFQVLLDGELPEMVQQRMARLLAKNLVRLWIVEAARRRYGNRIVLLGSNWRRFGQEAEPSAYNEVARLEYYRSAVVNLDCGSKSGDNALYPRSSELISFAGGLLQVRCADSDAVFGSRVDEFCFTDESTLLAQLERRMSEPASLREARDAWLVAHLRHRQLLMQDSVRALLAA